MQLYHGPLPHLSKGSLGPGEGAGRRPDPNLFQAWITASEDMEDQLWVRDAPAHLSSCFGAWLCPQGLCQPCVPSRHPCVSLHLQHRAQAVLASPECPMCWPCPGAVCSNSRPGAAAPPSTALLVRGAGPQFCWGSGGSAGHSETRASPGHSWQVPAVLAAFLWDSGVHGSGNFLSECRRMWWKGNL